MPRNLNRSPPLTREKILENIAKRVKAKARKVYPRQPIVVWTAMLSDRYWRSFVINTAHSNRVIMCFGPLAPGPEEAMNELGEKLDKMVSKTPNKRRTRKTP
jgi:hypothetical protein